MHINTCGKFVLKIAFIITTFLFVTIYGINSDVYANQEFDTRYNVTYKVQETGETQVSQEISIVNKRNDILATSFSLIIKQLNIYDVSGEDAKGPLEIEQITENNVNTIYTKFNNQIVGEGRNNDFTIQYKTKNIATKVGEIWNVHIPKVEALDEINNYTVDLVVPNTFGPEIFVSPQPDLITEDLGKTIYQFEKNTLNDVGINASFGQYQVLNFKLDYLLSNESVFSQTQQIALPPDIKERQQINIDSVYPKPKRVFQDKDGNTIAEFQVPSNETLTITAIGSARISGKQIQPDFGGAMESIPEELIKSYTSEDKYWEVNSIEIQEAAKRLFDPYATTAQNAQNIYNFITNNLEYDFSVTEEEFVERRGALSAISQEGGWACMEFTDLFIAISRAMGIPARELNGFAFAGEDVVAPLSIDLRGGDLLHAWPEFYDPEFGWVAIDPTWGNTSGIDYFTKLDTSHFAFVIKGLDSEFPLPAGAYKLEGNEKQVEVEFAEEENPQRFNENITIYNATTWNPIKKFQGKKRYLVQNTGGVTVYDVNGSGKNLPPQAIMSVHLLKESTSIQYRDFNGQNKLLRNLQPRDDHPQTTTSETTKIIALMLFGVLLLCGIFYVAIAHPKSLQKLVLLLLRRPQDLNQ